MRLINADALKEAKFLTPQVRVIGGRHSGKLKEQIIQAYQKGWNDAIDTISNNAPTVEYPVYQEAYQTGYEEGKNARPQGEWITRHKENSFGQDVVCFECNKCGEYKLPIIHTMIIEPLRVCPNCGAKMGGEKNDG